MPEPAEGHGLKRGSAWAVGLGCWALSLWLAVTWLLPGSPWGPNFSSDGAIPLLMARAPRVDLFIAYYLGQDRFGAWPFLLARLLGGRDWPPEGLAAVLIAATWTAVFPLAWLSRQGVVAVGLCVLVPLVLALPEEVRPYLLDISQPYGWQFAMLAWTWMGLRGFMEARTRPGVWGWGVATTMAAALTVWISTSSLPSLGVFLGVEALRARARGLAGWRRFAAAARDAALEMARLAPGRLLMGGYWDVFQLAGLQPLASQRVPVPTPEDHQRTAYDTPRVKTASDLVWVQRREAPLKPVPLERELQGVKFQREPEPWLSVPGYTFWKYVRGSTP